MISMWWARWSIWIVGCAVATAVVIGNAFYQKKQFYPTVVYITKSKPSMAVMYAQALLFVVMLGKLFRKLFFGQLRAAEFEHLVERSWYAVTETCLAFTVFRDDFSPKFLALFTLLLFLKSFHWLAEERVDYMERSPVITWVFHIRVLSLLSLLLLLDGYFVNVAYQSTITKGASVQLVFGFEYAILTTIVLNTVAKYIFHVVDMQNESPWENKAVFVLHTEVIIGLCKVILYILFVIIMVRIYTLPLFALRPTYLALRAFKKALNDVIMSRRAINNMNNLYPDVTQEELAATDNVCIICREEMSTGAKKLPCNHIFHVSCLRSWFQRQQTCPTCRLNVLRVQNATPTPPPVVAPARQAFRIQGQPGFGAGFQMGLQAFQNFQQWQQQPNPRQQVPQAQAPVAPVGNDQPQAANAQPGAAAAAAENIQNQGAGAVRPQFQQQQQPFMFNPMAPPQGFGGFVFRPPTTTTAAGPAIQPQQFNFPPMPYIPLVPPPPPLLQTTGLSDEELRRMEGNSRENVEARLRCLRNVQILLDSAVVQMQQYTAVVANLNTQTSEETRGGQGPSTSSPSSSSAPGATEATTTPPTQSESVNKESVPTPSVVNNGNIISQTNSESATTSSPQQQSGEASSSSSQGKSTPSASVLPPNEQDELRKRRLQKFSNQGQSEPTSAGGTGGE